MTGNCQAMDGDTCYRCPRKPDCAYVFVVQPVATLLAFGRLEANLDHAYTDDSVKRHVETAFKDGANTVAVKWREKWHVCVPGAGGYERRAAEANEAAYYERLVEEAVT